MIKQLRLPSLLMVLLVALTLPISTSAFLGRAKASASEIEVASFDKYLNLTLPLIQGGLFIGTLASPVGININGRALKPTPKGRIVFGLGRDAPDKLTIILTTPQGQTLEKTFEVLQRRYHSQHIDGIGQKYVQPTLAARQQIKQEAQLITLARQQSLPLLGFLEYFEWPVIGRITGVYGSERFYNGQPRRPHYGVDIAAPKGTMVRAPAFGEITLIKPDMYYSGGTVILDHGHGVSSTFLHLDSINVRVGDQIKQGQFIGRVGSTGRSTGPHLDWRVNWFTTRLDPELLVEDMPQ